MEKYSQYTDIEIKFWIGDYYYFFYFLCIFKFKKRCLTVFMGAADDLFPSAWASVGFYITSLSVCVNK